MLNITYKVFRREIDEIFGVMETKYLRWIAILDLNCCIAIKSVGLLV
jgi:hypothetical protein